MPHSNMGWVDRLEDHGQLARLSAMLCRQLDADGLALTVVDGDELLQAASHGPLVTDIARGGRFARAAGGLSWRAIEEQRPLVVPDARGVRLAVDPGLAAGAAAAAPIYAISGQGQVETGEMLGALVWVWERPQSFAPTILDDIERSAVFASLQVELEFALGREKMERDLAAQVVEALGEVMLVVGEDGRINRVNASAERMFGYPREQLLQMNVDQLVPAASRSSHARRRASFIDEEGAPSRTMAARSTEIRAVRADGTEVPVEVGLSLLPGDEHRPPQVIAIVSDISERLRSQAAAERQQRLEAVGQFAGGLAHDVNNALTVILGFTQMAHDRADDDVRSLLHEVLEAGSHAGELSKQLLVFARTEPQPVMPLDVNALLRELSSMASRLLGDHIIVETELEEDLPPALGDATQLQQVLVNLVLNARDAMPAGGTIALRSGITRSLGTAQRVQVVVTDSGCGMDEETLQRATDPFFTTKGEQGTGLGLATAYTLVRALGGELSLESEPGAGTVVTIALPVSLDRAAAAPAYPVHAATTEPLSILLVEDSDAVRAMTAYMLRALGHEVVAVRVPRDALAHDLDAYDLVVSDVEMPGMSGPEMVTAMRARRPRLPVVYTSGYSSESHSEQLRVAAGAPFVMKPFTPDELAAGIELALAQSRG